MGDLPWKRKKHFVYPQKALRYSAVILGSSGSGKSETIRRAAYGAHKVYRRQVILLDAKGNTKRDDEESEDSAARFLATMRAAGAHTIKVFPALHYAGWQGSAPELKNRLLSVIDYSESAYYGDVAANVLDLALSAQPTPRTSRQFLANLQFERLKELHKTDPFNYPRVLDLNKKLLKEVEMRYQVFFAAMAGQLDGTLDYADADAVYLRVRGFVLREYADRILDACSTYILHACSDPFQVSKRAGKRWKLETTYTEDEEGQAFWIYKGRSQQVQTALVPITGEQVREAWDEIRHQEETQRTLLEQQAERRQRQAQPQQSGQSSAPQTAPRDLPPVSSETSVKGKERKQPKPTPTSSRAKPNTPAPKASKPVSPQQPQFPPSAAPGVDDDEPDEL